MMTLIKNNFRPSPGAIADMYTRFLYQTIIDEANGKVKSLNGRSFENFSCLPKIGPVYVEW